jgi:hypothetical protein
VVFQESGIAVDGVFAINSPFVVSVLRATGPIELPDYRDRITADLLWKVSLLYTKFFFPAHYKKDFLGTSARACFGDNHRREYERTRTASSRLTSLLEHDIPFDVCRWRYSVTRGRCGPGECRHHLDVWVWTMRHACLIRCRGRSKCGVNKVNVFVSRDMKREVTV